MSAISVQAVMRDAASWAALSVRYESAGFDSLLVADHPGARPSPFLALAAAAAVTDRIGLGTNVANIGIRDPFLVASDVATLDVLSNGRARLGLGAGHNPAEWASVGRSRPAVSGRVDRFIEAAEAIRELLAGRAVDLDSETTKVRGRLTEPLPVQDLVPLTVGGSNARLLRGPGSTLTWSVSPDSVGHFPTAIRHEVRWSHAEIDAHVTQAHAGSADARAAPEIEALVQTVVVTGDAAGAAHELGEELGVSVDDVLAAPFVLIGAEDEIVKSIRSTGGSGASPVTSCGRTVPRRWLVSCRDSRKPIGKCDVDAVELPVLG